MKTLGLLLLLLFFALPALAADDIREERVHFKAGTSGTTVKGHLRGRDTVDYLLGAKAGQHMTVELHTDNPQNYFNILPPGSSDEAIFVGSSSGNRATPRLRAPVPDRAILPHPRWRLAHPFGSFADPFSKPPRGGASTTEDSRT